MAFHSFSTIDIAVENKRWKPFPTSIRGPKVSHLAFADDLILFAEATMEQASLIKETLKLFCESSGQRVSQDKTRVFFSKNVHWDQRGDISNELGFQSTDDLGKYLGVPIFHKKVSRHTFNFVIDKVNQRLSTWKAANCRLREDLL